MDVASFVLDVGRVSEDRQTAEFPAAYPLNTEKRREISISGIMRISGITNPTAIRYS
jgi:hypothetical protein